MLKDPKFRREIYVGIIAAILVMSLVEPLLRFAGNTILWAGSNIYEGFTNSVYKSAALGFREKFSFFTLVIIFSILAGFYAALSTALFLLDRPPPSMRGVMKRKYISLILALSFFMMSFYVVGKNFAELQLNASFNQRLTVLAPKLTDLQIKELRASWALMEKRADYVALNKEMESFASKLNVKLPANLWE